MSRSKIAALENLPKKPQSADDLQPGEAVCNGRFEIEARLGKGGVATVYRAKDATRGSTVALKILHESRATDPRELQRFHNEIAITEHIPAHPNLLQPFETGTLDEDNRPYLLSERGKGPTLGSIIIFAPLDEDRALSIFEDIATGLCHMHDAGVLHRDIKPSNVIVEKDGDRDAEQARLFDFGYAIAEKDLRDLPPQSRLTQAGELPGTKHYMAPEQVLGHPASPTSDVYALGISLYEALTGAPPYADLEPADAAIKKATKGNQIPDISTKRDVSANLRALVMDAIATDPEERIADAHTFLSRLRSVRSAANSGAVPSSAVTDDVEPALAPPVSTRSRLPIVALAVSSAALLGVLGSWFVLKEKPRDRAGLETPADASANPLEAPPEPKPVPEPKPTPEAEPVPQPVPEPEPVPQAVPEPKPTPEPEAKPTPSTPAPRPEVDCAKEKSAAQQAADWGNWSQLKKHTRHAKCWTSRLEWERLRAKALYKTGNKAACRKLADKSKHAEIQRYSRICASMPTETPE